MIASVRGTVLSAGLDSAVVDVGGVGLLLHTTAGTAASLQPGAQATLVTTLVVREDSLTLYGFADEDERAVFTMLQTVAGVGPRLALTMLAIHAPDGLRRAIGSGDLVALTKVPGIGKKGAERIVLELRDKIGVASGAAAVTTRRRAASDGSAQVHDALVGLGWSPRQAEEAVQAVTAGRTQAANGADNGAANGAANGAGNGSTDGSTDGSDVSTLLRAALRELGR
jgi:Holliday junction DNA helicase RuvA